MNKKTLFLALALAILVNAVVNERFRTSSSYASPSGNLTLQESQIIALVNGTNAYNYDLELEKIALNHSISNYSFRAGGSAGATATAMWLEDQFESFGLETQLESFEFTNWNLPSQPTLIMDQDGVVDTTNDQTVISSFQSEHYSWPTSENGAFADLVVLPLPSAASFGEIGLRPIDTALWNTINTQGKIVLIGREIRWNPSWEQTYQNKLSSQKPVAVVYTWWYPWMSFSPPLFSSVGGRPTSSLGPYYWNLEISAGWVNYDDGLLLRDRESVTNVSAKVTIPSVIEVGPHYNVVGKLQGNSNPDKFVVISGHYDTVMTAGFVDNGAGTAGVLEVARVFSYAAREGLYNFNYTLLFVAFASEELGLIGSANYVKQHKARMEDIVAVINLDCIGSDSLEVARTDPAEAFDLDALILKAASDLNIAATLTEPGGSDHEVFLNPVESEGIHSYWWPELSAGISDAAPVKSSTMLISRPLLYSDKWNMNKPGWIHTTYDNSTSTQTLTWLESDNLEEHIKVAVLSAVRVSPSSPGATTTFSIPWWTWEVVVAAAAVVVVMVVRFVKMKKPLKENVVQ